MVTQQRMRGEEADIDIDMCAIVENIVEYSQRHVVSTSE